MTSIKDYAPIFPQQDIMQFRSRMEESNPRPGYEFSHWAGFLSLQTFGLLDPRLREQAFIIANGNAGAAILPDKYKFGTFVKDLDYLAPTSMLIDPRGNIEDPVNLEGVEAIDSSSPMRFCKPLNATQGRGTFIAESPRSASGFVSQQDEPYLIQSFERPAQDWRYILHRDAIDVTNGDPPSWRIAIHKVRPEVTGDGISTIETLVRANDDMPSSAKDNYFKTHAEVLYETPKAGEVVELVSAGNQAQGAYAQLGTPTELKNLDRFMAQFLEDTEASLGTTLGTLCVDLGVKKMGLLSEDFSMDAYKENIVFYEHQMPFGTLLKISPEVSWGPLDKLVPAKYRTEYVKAQIYSNLMRSVIRSGRLLRSKYKLANRGARS